MEDYPSLAEGNGLENRQACKSVRGFESHILLYIIVAGWSSSVARRAHNPKVVGSNPAPAIEGSVAQLVEHLICNQRVACSSHVAGIINSLYANVVQW